MERHAIELQEKLAGLLIEAAQVSVDLDRLNGTVQGVPHYSIIELRAHELGRQLSRQIQQHHMAAVVNHHVGGARCPAGGTESTLEAVKRPLASIDGSVERQELEGSCRKCRRSFFPSPGT